MTENSMGIPIKQSNLNYEQCKSIIKSALGNKLTAELPNKQLGDNVE